MTVFAVAMCGRGFLKARAADSKARRYFSKARFPSEDFQRRVDGFRGSEMRPAIFEGACRGFEGASALFRSTFSFRGFSKA
ncbi:hypothetical protein, partial [Bhargavaea cecembensis]|uniref:hypothetical protein n=1 Tax=Bhargavaea cecembensis TaxID=394098 RepID=UPI001C54DF68